MKYVARIRRVADGLERDCVFDTRENDDHTVAWMWREGNWACDCNRFLDFERAAPDYDPALDDDDGDDLDCTDGKYELVSITFDDGRVVGQFEGGHK